MEKELTGRIYDIQGFSVQDGPGVRTTVFLKGCPLHCPWCHSPESQSFQKQLSWMSQRCKGVKACNSRCIHACKKNAVEFGSVTKDSMTGEELQLVHVKRDICDDCGDCADACYAGALTICGEDYTVDRLVTRLIREKPFYKGGGGVTISGGECLWQIDFVLEVLKRLKAAAINTAIDTTGYAKWEVIESILPFTDLFLYDLKHMDSKKHEAATGVKNERILENCIKIAENGGKMQIRIPVIPKFNNDEENIRKTAEFCSRIKDAVTLVQLLPYHNMGVMKYLRISDQPVMEAVPPTDEYMKKLQGIFEEYDLPVQIH